MTTDPARGAGGTSAPPGGCATGRAGPVLTPVAGCENLPVTDENGWRRLLAERPGHSRWYIERFREMARKGDDLAGEARLIDAMAPRGARILDAGCGSGRVGGHLAAAGHRVVGVDLDPELIAEARRNHPGPLHAGRSG